MSFKLPHQSSSPFAKKENAKQQYENFSRFEKPEVKKFIDSLKTNDPFNKHIDYIYDSESRRAENNYYSPGEVIKSKKPKTDNPILQREQKLREKIEKTRKKAFIRSNSPSEDYEESRSEKRAQKKLARQEKRLVKVKRNSALKQNELDDSTYERLAEIKATKERMNSENNISKEEKHKQDLLRDIPEAMMQQRLGSSGSLGLILGGGAKGLYNIGKYVAKNVLKKGAIKGVDKL